MKKYFAFLFLFISLQTFAQHGEKYTVYWKPGYIGNASLMGLSYKILQEVSKDNIKAFDEDGNPLTKSQIKKRIPPEFLICPLSELEVQIALRNGDFSVLELVDTKYTEEDLERMMKDNVDYMQFFRKIKLKKIKPFEIKQFKLEIHEEITLDTNDAKQDGIIKFVKILIPQNNTISKKDELLFQVNYNELRKLNLNPQQKMLSERSFIIYGREADMAVVKGTEVNKLSEAVRIGQDADKKLLDKSIFKYFKKSIRLYNATYPYGMPEGEFFNKDFNWAIDVPEYIEPVPPKDWVKQQNKGEKYIEEAIEVDVENNSKIIFVLRKDKTNYLESLWQPFDTLEEGNYDEVSKGVNELLIETFKFQMPGVGIDTAYSTEQIDGLVFNKFRMTIFFPNQIKVENLMYSRIFDKKEFCLNIITTNNDSQNLFLHFWRNSRFGK